MVPDMLAAEWPGITFTLPQTVDFSNFAIDPPALPVAATEIVTLNGETFAAHADDVERRIIDGDPAAAAPLGILNAGKRRGPRKHQGR